MRVVICSRARYERFVQACIQDEDSDRFVESWKTEGEEVGSYVSQ